MESDKETDSWLGMLYSFHVNKDILFRWKKKLYKCFYLYRFYLQRISTYQQSQLSHSKPTHGMCIFITYQFKPNTKHVGEMIKVCSVFLMCRHSFSSSPGTAKLKLSELNQKESLLSCDFPSFAKHTRLVWFTQLLNYECLWCGLPNFYAVWCRVLLEVCVSHA